MACVMARRRNSRRRFPVLLVSEPITFEGELVAYCTEVSLTFTFQLAIVSIQILTIECFVKVIFTRYSSFTMLKVTYVV